MEKKEIVTIFNQLDSSIVRGSHFSIDEIYSFIHMNELNKELRTYFIFDFLSHPQLNNFKIDKKELENFFIISFCEKIDINKNDFFYVFYKMLNNYISDNNFENSIQREYLKSFLKDIYQCKHKISKEFKEKLFYQISLENINFSKHNYNETEFLKFIIEIYKIQSKKNKKKIFSKLFTQFLNRYYNYAPSINSKISFFINDIYYSDIEVFENNIEQLVKELENDDLFLYLLHNIIHFSKVKFKDSLFSLCFYRYLKINLMKSNGFRISELVFFDTYYEDLSLKLIKKSIRKGLFKNHKYLNSEAEQKILGKVKNNFYSDIVNTLFHNYTHLNNLDYCLLKDKSGLLNLYIRNIKENPYSFNIKNSLSIYDYLKICHKIGHKNLSEMKINDFFVNNLTILLNDDCSLKDDFYKHIIINKQI